MELGMLYFDNASTETLEQKVEKAAAYYEKKYGRRPNHCLVHRGALSESETGEILVNGVTVREFRPVLPNHLWIGMDEEPAYTAESRTLNAKQIREVVE